MKKTNLFICALAVCTLSTSVAFQCYKQSKLTDFALRNLIALTNGEDGDSGSVGGLTPGESSSHHYPDKSGTPQKCTIYRYYSLDGGAKIYEGSSVHPDLETRLGFDFRREEQVGLEDSCGKDGSGCNPYTCQTIAYVP